MQEYDCSFYFKNLNSLSKDQKELFEERHHAFKIHYIYRAFNIDFKPLSRISPVKGLVALPKIYASNYVLGLVLTYYVNYGLSARKTASIMKNIHQVNISHKTVLTYANTVSIITKPFVDRYPYELSDSICGDETYIRVNDKWHYIFFFFDVSQFFTQYACKMDKVNFTLAFSYFCQGWRPIQGIF